MTEAKRGYWRLWLKAAAFRAIRTFAQTLAAALMTATVMSDVSWPMALSAAGLAAILSMLTSLGGLPEVDEPTEDSDKTTVLPVIVDGDDAC